MNGTDILTILLHLTYAAIAGALIGFERSYHGRPAGFRTHILVCIASSLLMLLPEYQPAFMDKLPIETLRLDPTRMAQGIMTGIGFLGAGAIMRAGLSVRGLTTAASIWMTASIGIMFGVGFYMPAVIATIVTFLTLSIFRSLETKMPSFSFAHLTVRFPRESITPVADVERMINELGIAATDPSYVLMNEGKHFEYRMTIRTKNGDNFSRLSDKLKSEAQIAEFQIIAATEQ